jgi:hypothetical protein
MAYIGFNDYIKIHMEGNFDRFWGIFYQSAFWNPKRTSDEAIPR